MRRSVAFMGGLVAAIGIGGGALHLREGSVRRARARLSFRKSAGGTGRRHRTRDRDGDPFRARHRAGRQPGVGSHLRALRRFRFAREEGASDRPPGRAALPGRRRTGTGQSRRRSRRAGEGARGGRRRRPPFWSDIRAVAKGAGGQGRPGHRHGQGQERQGRRGGRPRQSGAGQGRLQPGPGEPRLHDHRLAHQRGGDFAQRRRGADRGGVAAGADVVHHRRGPGEDAGARGGFRGGRGSAGARDAGHLRRRRVPERAVQGDHSPDPGRTAEPAERRHLRRGHRRRQPGPPAEARDDGQRDLRVRRAKERPACPHGGAAFSPAGSARGRGDRRAGGEEAQEGQKEVDGADGGCGRA